MLPAAPPALEPTTSRPVWWTALLRNRAAAVSGGAMLVLIVLALLGPGLYQGLLPAPERQTRDGIYQDYNAINADTSAQHWLGTD
jgi:hypothetical protein